VRQLAEVWELAGRDLSDRRGVVLARDGGGSVARPHFADVRRTDLDSTLDLTADEMRKYVTHSFAHKQLAARIPEFEGARAVTASSTVFVATRLT